MNDCVQLPENHMIVGLLTDTFSEGYTAEYPPPMHTSNCC